MLNQVMLVGKILKEMEIIETNETKKAILTLAIPRSFKNDNGEYETDLIDCVLCGPIAENTREYCKRGDIVGVKGRVQSDENKVMQVVAEKVTFLSTKKNNEDEG